MSIPPVPCTRSTQAPVPACIGYAEKLGLRYTHARTVPMVVTAALLSLTTAAFGDAQFAQMESAPCAPGSPGHGRAWCDASSSIAERVDTLVNALPVSTFPGQLTDMNFGGSLANVSSMGLPKFAFNHEACHGILDCNACGEQGSCAHECPTAPTSFPQVVGLAASFNSTLWSLVGQTISTEARANANIAGSNDPLNFWAPNMNILRDPRWGRAQGKTPPASVPDGRASNSLNAIAHTRCVALNLAETPGEDPLINGDYAVHFVQGMQQRGVDPKYIKVGATCKHAFGYSLEGHKCSGGGDPECVDPEDRHHFNAVISPQDLADTYLPPFERCVREGKPASLMCSYNAVNGVPSCSSTELLTNITRREWNFTGIWVSDCGAVDDILQHHRYTKTGVETVKASLLAGLDLNCGNFFDEYLGEALSSGAVTTATVHASLKRIYTLRMELGEFDEPQGNRYRNLNDYGHQQLAHFDVALEAGRQALVLLKNDGVLPFSVRSNVSLALIGTQLGHNEAIKGNYAGNTQPSPNLQQAVSSLCASAIHYSLGSTLCGGVNQTAIEEAITTAKQSDAVVLSLGTDGSGYSTRNKHSGFRRLQQQQHYDEEEQVDDDEVLNCIESEGTDRTSISVPANQLELYRAILATTKAQRKPLVLIVFSGGAVDLQFARDEPGVSAIIWAGFPSTAGPSAIAETLFGLNSPSGRLTQTFYSDEFTKEVAITDMAMRPSSRGAVGSTSKGRGYRFYSGDSVVYPFGSGLTYSSFSWTELVANTTGASCRLTNTGRRSAAVSTLLFLVPPKGAAQGTAPRRFLAAYAKHFLQPAEHIMIRLEYAEGSLTLAQPSQSSSEAKKVLAKGQWTAAIETATATFNV